MSDLIGELVASQSAEELDAVVEKISMEKIVALADEEASSLKTQLTSLLESPLVDNSKRRRRITRLVSNLEDRSKAEEKIKAQQETAAPTAWVSGGTRSNSTSATNTKKTGPMTPEEVADKLAVAQSPDDVALCLNSLKVPPRDPATGEHSVEFLSIRVTLKTALEATLQRTDIVNKALQRRVSRLIFSLLTAEEKEEEKKAAAARPKQAPPVPKARRGDAGYAAAAVAGPTSLLPFIAALTATKTSEEVEAALTTAGVNFVEVVSCVNEEVQQLREVVDSIVADEEKSGNAKLRRRLTRVKESLDKVAIYNAAEAQAGTGTDDTADTAAAAAGAGATTATTDDSGKVLADILMAVKAASDGKELESAVTGLPSDVNGSDMTAMTCLLELEALLAKLNDNAEMVATAPQRRKMKRAMDAVGKLKSSSVSSSSSGAGPGKEGEGEGEGELVLVHNPEPGPPLEGTIEAVRAASTAEELETAVKTVKPGSGNNKSRRTLKRALAALLADESKEWIKALNSKARRGISRVQAMLEPVPDSGVKAVKRSLVTADSGGNKKAKVEDDGEEAGKDAVKVAPNPYILFIGQLSFGTRVEDIRRHMEANGLSQDDVRGVRLLSDENKVSKGMCFVDLASTEALHKGLSLHHTVLHGRRLNVEKSCGGRNKDQRQQKIASFRQDQTQAVRDKIDVVIKDFEETRKVITREGLGKLLIARLYTFSARQVGDLLAQFELRPKEQRSLKDLDRLCDALNEKLKRKNVPAPDATYDGYDGGEGAVEGAVVAEEDGMQGISEM